MSEENTPPEGGDKTFTQADVDRIVSERLGREKGKYADYDELKAKAEKFDEHQAASKSEVDQLRDQIAERDAQLADLPKQARQQAIRFASKASAKGFLDPEDALTFLGSDVDLADDDAVDKALDDLAGRKPHLVRTTASKQAQRPKPKAGDKPDDDGEPQGKARAAAALRQFRNTR